MSHPDCPAPDTSLGNVLGVPAMPDGCFLCRPKPHEILDENDLCMTLQDSHPVVEGHCLIIPRRHAPTVFDLTAEEAVAVQDLLRRAQSCLQQQDPSITGFNFGVNAGQSAGQSVFHCHYHLFPRRDGDQENPRGGVRRIFPDKALYKRR